MQLFGATKLTVPGNKCVLRSTIPAVITCYGQCSANITLYRMGSGKLGTNVRKAVNQWL